MTTPKSKSLIHGLLLIHKLGIDFFELCYFTIKYQLTVLEDPEMTPRKVTEAEGRRSGFRKIDSEELLWIIQHHAQWLITFLFKLSEVERLPPPKAKTKDCPPRDLSRVERDIDIDPVKLKRKFKPELHRSYSDLGARTRPKHMLWETIEDHESQIKESPNVFTMLGRVWFAKFNNEEWGLYPDQQKYRYIAGVLSLCDGDLRNCASEFSIYNDDLYAKVTRKVPAKDFQADSRVTEELRGSDLSDILSVRDIKNFEEIGYKLLDEL